MALQTEHCKKLLEQLPEPKTLWKWMLWCAEIPRGSGHTEQVSPHKFCYWNVLALICWFIDPYQAC